MLYVGIDIVFKKHECFMIYGKTKSAFSSKSIASFSEDEYKSSAETLLLSTELQVI